MTLLYRWKEKFLSFIEIFPPEVSSFVALALTSSTNQIVRLFTGIINAKLLTPVLYATNSLSSMIVRYSSYGHLGVQNGLNRQIPIEYGKENGEEVDVYLISTFWLISGIAVVFCIVFGVLYFSNILHSDIVPRAYYIDILLLSVSTLYYQYFISLLVSTKRFFLISELRMKFGVGGALLSVIGVLFFRLHGLLLFQAALLFIQTIIIQKRIRFRVEYRCSLSHLLTLWKVGSLILISSVLTLFCVTLDLLFVASIFKRELVGLYGFAMTSVGFYRVYAVSISDVLAPKIGNHFGANAEKAESLKIFATDCTFVIVPILGMLAAVFFFILPLVIRIFLPAYIGSIKPFQYLLLAVLSQSVCIPCGHIITVLRKQKQLILLTIAVALLTILLLYRFVDSAKPISDVAIIILITSVVSSILIVLLSHYFVSGDQRYPWRSIIRNIASFGCVVAVFLGLASIENVFHSFVPLVLLEVSKLILCEILLLMIFFHFDRNNRIVVKLRQLLENVSTRSGVLQKAGFLWR